MALNRGVPCIIDSPRSTVAEAFAKLVLLLDKEDLYVNHIDVERERSTVEGIAGTGQIWEKYGIVGLGIIGTFTVGAPVSIAVGVGFNVNMHKLAAWCCIGVLARCIVFTLIGHFGMKLF